jgi:hypothetical protein
MKTYYYVHTGHRIGLDRFRRASAIIKALEGVEIILLSSDFRIAQIAKEYGIDNAVGIDVVRNIPYIAEHGDRLLFDSDEANPLMIEDMKNFFSTFIHIKNDTIAIDDIYFQKKEKTVPMSYFFGDDDYEKDLEKNFTMLHNLEFSLQLGFYYFLDYEDMLKEKFPQYFEFEEYQDMIRNTDILLTSSPQAALESLASGGRPIYLQREDYTQDYNHLFEELKIPIITYCNNTKLQEQIKILKQHRYSELDKKSNKKIQIIKKALEL